jgi:coenzyme F420-reducing hydrogenase beta subunit
LEKIPKIVEAKILMKSQIEQVVAGDYCTGCGLCSFASSREVPMRETVFGTLQPDLEKLKALDPVTLDRLDKVCPFSSSGENETEIASRLFPAASQSTLESGRYETAYAGHCIGGGFRDKGSSGGMTSWFLCELLRRGVVKQVIHVHESAKEGSLFDFTISQSPEEVRAGAKSRYYAVSYADVLSTFQENPRSTAVVGVPCFIKAIRRLAQVDDVVKEHFKVHVALVCGHLKSRRYAEMMGWQKGINPGNLRSIDFRLKMPGVDAHTYGVEFEDESGRSQSDYAYRFFGTSWGEGMFKLHGCDFCDDVLGETADVVFGDAWIDKYDKDWKGTNIAIVRNPIFVDWFVGACDSGDLHLEEIDTKTLVKSQDGSFRHRHDGLVWRLRSKEQSGEWVPKKRFESRRPTLREVPEQLMNQTRMQIAQKSHLAYAKARVHGSFELFRDTMEPIRERYYWQLAARDLTNGRFRLMRQLVKKYVKSKAPWIKPIAGFFKTSFRKHENKK